LTHALCFLSVTLFLFCLTHVLSFLSVTMFLFCLTHVNKIQTTQKHGYT
jgi:hypothetical protein